MAGQLAGGIQGTEPVGNSPVEFEAFIKSEYRKWAVVIKQAGIRVD